MSVFMVLTLRPDKLHIHGSRGDSYCREISRLHRETTGRGRVLARSETEPHGTHPRRTLAERVWDYAGETRERRDRNALRTQAESNSPPPLKLHEDEENEGEE